MHLSLAVAGSAALLAWLYLTFFNGRFWRADQHLDDALPPPAAWPAVSAVVPARNEADVVAATVGSLLDQDYPGEFRVFLVDDQSDDGTAAEARRLAARHRRGERLEVVTTCELPSGWMGKMWAVATGVGAARREASPRYLLLTDADVAHHHGSLRRLVAKAEAEELDLVSLMVLLARRGLWERLLIPAFVYFFQMLYPFPRVNDPGARTAGAAGGCMLVRAGALERAGGIAAIRGEVIDDCALGRNLKRHGPIWLGLTTSERSVRPYGGLGGVWKMVSRSAFDQLGYSVLLLAGTLLGMVLIYLLPPVLVLTWPLHGETWAGLAGGAAWLLMALTFAPTLILYGGRREVFLGPALPLAALLYLGMTFDSAWRHWRGVGVRWKGRAVGGA